MILGYSRKMYAELIERCDLPSFLDCHIRAFEYLGGVSEQILYDRMKNVYIGKIAGKAKFNDTLVGFALHYGFKPEVAPSYAAGSRARWSGPTILSAKAFGADTHLSAWIPPMPTF
jgi:transposase